MNRPTASRRRPLRTVILVSVLVSVVLACGVALLAWRALDGIARERVAGRREDAERVFAAVERQLDALLIREEERPFAQYRYFYVPDAQITGSVGLNGSPLAQLPTDPVLIGYFQIDPDGTVTTPMRPRNEALACKTTGWAATPELTRREHLLRDSVADFFPVPALVAPPIAVTPVPQQTEPVIANAGSSFNPGSRNRGSSQTKVPASSVYNFQNEQSAGDNVIEAQIDQGYGQMQQALSLPGGTANAIGQTDNNKVFQSIAKALNVNPDRQLDVRMTPLRGHLVAGGRLVLEREVQLGAERYRQGLVLNRDGFVAQIETAALSEADPTNRVHLTWLDGNAQPTTDTFVHHLPEPFAALTLSARVIDAPESGLNGRRAVLVLVAALLAAGALGAVALLRAVVVTVHFAERRNDFVAAVTHELKTPLTAIRMHGEMLRDGMVNDEARKQLYYRTMTDECERLSRLIDNVLDLARLERGAATRRGSLGDIAPVLRAAVELVEPKVRAAGFAVVLKCPDDLPAARFDRDGLTQVIINVVDNALKFAVNASERTIAITVAVTGGHLRISVADHGPGVPARQLARIFQPFYRGERELTRTTTGTGIGLALVKGLIAGMGGEVAARNRPEHGFEIEIALTLA